MYWQRAIDLGEPDGNHGSKTVYLPRSNLFDVLRVIQNPM
jgi:hypothetical protein